MAVESSGTKITQITVLSSVRRADGWVNIQTKLSNPAHSPELSRKARRVVRNAG